MKKLLMLIVVLQIILVILITLKLSVQNNHAETTINDTIINRVRIDSIHFLITEKESIINRINIIEKYEIEKAINSNDSDAIKLFKVLVAE